MANGPQPIGLIRRVANAGASAQPKPRSPKPNALSRVGQAALACSVAQLHTRLVHCRWRHEARRCGAGCQRGTEVRYGVAGRRRDRLAAEERQPHRQQVGAVANGVAGRQHHVPAAARQRRRDGEVSGSAFNKKQVQYNLPMAKVLMAVGQGMDMRLVVMSYDKVHQPLNCHKIKYCDRCL